MKRLIALLGVGMVGLSLLAQQPPSVAAAPTAIDPLTGLPVARQETGPKFAIEFPGGDPEDLIKEITKASHERPNVVIQPECSSANIPAFRLRDVTASQIFQTLNTLWEPDFDQGIWRQVQMQDGEIWTLAKAQPQQQQMFGMRGMPGMSGAPAQKPEPPVMQRPICRIYNLAPFLDTFKVEDITTAIQGAWEMVKSDLKPSFKYHKDTKLLIAFGGPEDLSLIQEVLAQLQPSLGRPLSTTPPPTTAKAPTKKE